MESCVTCTESVEAEEGSTHNGLIFSQIPYLPFNFLTPFLFIPRPLPQTGRLFFFIKKSRQIFQIHHCQIPQMVTEFAAAIECPVYHSAFSLLSKSKCRAPVGLQDGMGLQDGILYLRDCHHVRKSRVSLGCQSTWWGQDCFSERTCS